jgi:hypothetical protein
MCLFPFFVATRVVRCGKERPTLGTDQFLVVCAHLVAGCESLLFTVPFQLTGFLHPVGSTFVRCKIERACMDSFGERFVLTERVPETSAGD